MGGVLVIFVALLFSLSWGNEFIENLIKKLDERGNQAWWWDERWWKDGYIEPPRNYKVKVEWVTV
ncbi:MAG TPA: dienelactone hydrolase, partial [Aigarchaeota archaeon]|nr:dienelactone hydrolase [Aigarchaeota archaeon]